MFYYPWQVRKRRILNKLILTMLGKTLSAVALLAGNAAAKIFYAGVAESGGEFGVYSKSGPNGVPCCDN